MADEWSVVSTAPKSEWDVVSTSPKIAAPKAAASVAKEKPVYEDVIVQRTPVQTKTPGLFAGEEANKFDPTGKGLAGDPTMRRVMKESAVKEALGAGGNIESLLRSAFLPSEIKEKYPKSKEPILPTPERVGKMMSYGKVPEAYKPASEFAGMVGEQAVLFGVPEIVSAGKGVSKMLSAPSKLEQILKETGELGKKATLTAEEKAKLEANKILIEEARKRQALRTELGKSERKVPENLEINKAARSELNLGEPQVGADIAAGKDVDSQLRKTALEKFGTAEKLQETVGGGAFEKYKEVANTLQNQQPFGLSRSGQQLKDQLNNIVRGGAGDLRSFGEDTIKIAKDIKRELYGRDPLEITAAEIDEVAKTLPKSMSDPAKKIMAKEQIVAQEATGRRPVDWEVVDEKLRELRQRETSKAIEGYTGVERQRFGTAADRIENALKEWVGEQNYPRQAYREASEPLNRFKTKLGRALTEAEDIPYTSQTGPFLTSESRLSSVVFENKDTVKFAKELLGETEVNALGQQHAVNLLADKNAKDAVSWLNSSKSKFVDDVPGLRAKLDNYAANIARREKDASALEALRKQQEEALKGSEKLRETTRGELATKQETIGKINKALESPEELPAKFDKLRADMEKTGVFAKEDLDALQAQVDQINKIVSQKEKREAASQIAGSILKKIFTLGIR